MIRRQGIRHVRAPAVVGGYSPIWPPTRLAGCACWYDFRETFSESAGTIANVRNMVSGSDAMAEATNQPTFNATGINGMPSAAGNASNKKLISNEAAVAAMWTGAHTVIIVTRIVGGGDFFSGGRSDADSSNTVRCSANNNAPAFRPRYSRTDTTNAVAVLADTIAGRPTIGQVWSWTYSKQTGPRLYVNLAEAEVMTFAGIVGPDDGVPNQTGMFCRADQTPDQFTANHIGVVVGYTRILPAWERRGIVTALMGAYRISAT